MFTYIRRHISTRTLLVLAAGILALGLVLFTAAPAPAAPTVTWTPRSVNQTILPGESQTVPVSFTAAKSLSNVVVRVVPELEPYVQVNPSSFGSIAKGETVSFNVTVSAQASELPGTFDGTIQLRSASDPEKTYARPLPVIVNIWQSFINEDLQYSVLYPPDWSSSILPQGQTGGLLTDTVFFGHQDEESSISSLTIDVLEISLEQYLDLLEESLIELNRELQQFNGVEWIIIQFMEKDLSLSYMSAFTQRNGRVYQVVFTEGSDEDQAVFEEMLHTFTFTD